MRKATFRVLALMIITFVIMALRPVSQSRENSIVVSGMVTEIREGGTKDAVFSISGRFAGKYYINRGLENGLTLEILRQKTLGKPIEISYADHWTPLDPFDKAGQHITELKVDGEVLYSEL